MKNQFWKTYGFWIGLSEAAGIVSGLLSRSGMVIFRQTAIQPALSPPPLLFPIVWTVLYALMGIGAARIYLAPPSAERSKSLNLFIIQLTVNFFWSLIFFNTRAYGFALLWLILLFLLVLWMTMIYHKIDPPAALLQIPYLLWLSFAAYLNWAVWQLNQ